MHIARLVVLLFVVCACSAPTTSLADALSYPTGKGKSTELYNRSFALVIGIDAYREWPVLANAVADAKAVAAQLRRHGFEVTLKQDLNLIEMNDAFEEFISKVGGDRNARVLIWFAGHGHTVENEGYIVPTDGLNTPDEFLFTRSALSLRRFSEYMRALRNRHVLAIFDSCFSGTIFQVARSKVRPTNFERLSRPVRQFISSGGANQVVSDDGLFRKLFIAAINGEEDRADADSDGYVTGEELGFFLSKKLPALRSMQTPQYGKLRAFGLDRGDFVFQRRVRSSPRPTDGAAGHLEKVAKQTWSYIKDSSDVSVIQAFRKQFGKKHRLLDRLATVRLNELRLQEEATSGPAQKEPTAGQGSRQLTWTWDPSEMKDGTWGLKAIGMPSAWPSLLRLRKAFPNSQRTTVALWADGAQQHKDLRFRKLQSSRRRAYAPPHCQLGEATHLMGVIGALHGNAYGIEGVYPGAVIEHINTERGTIITPQQKAGGPTRFLSFGDVFMDIGRYLQGFKKRTGQAKLVLNLTLSMPKKFVDFRSNLAMSRHLEGLAQIANRMISHYEHDVLFVVPAGDNSAGQPQLIEAKWSSPLAWAGTVATGSNIPPENVLVVEAVDREGRRAPFSNTKGHVAAPGVDIMSTSSSSPDGFGICSGTATAASFVAGLAALLLELNPQLTPSKVASIIRESARPSIDKKGAPRVDAVAAVEMALARAAE